MSRLAKVFVFGVPVRCGFAANFSAPIFQGLFLGATKKEPDVFFPGHGL